MWRKFYQACNVILAKGILIEGDRIFYVKCNMYCVIWIGFPLSVRYLRVNVRFVNEVSGSMSCLDGIKTCQVTSFILIFIIYHVIYCIILFI